MRRRSAPDPIVARELAAIDAALAGGPVGESEADLARLATLLVAERERPAADFRTALDAQVAGRFATAGTTEPAGASGRERSGRRERPARRRRPLIPAFAATAAVALVALLVAVTAFDRGPQRPDEIASSGAATAAPQREPESDALGGAPSEVAPQTGTAAPGSGSFAAGVTGDALKRSSPLTRSSAPPASPGPGATNPAARKVERSATVELGAPADRVADVAQGVLGVVARNDGIVDRSSVATRSDGGEATFRLRIPAERLQAALAQLSRLPDAHVLSRTDDAVDVNRVYVSTRRALATAEAQRSGLLNALRAATDQTESDRLTLRLGELDARIAGLERDQRALDRRVDYSVVDLTVRGEADGVAGAGDEDGGGLTPAGALDDAGRVLAVSAAVAVIAAAALVPLSLVALALLLIVRTTRRWRREQALDGA